MPEYLESSETGVPFMKDGWRIFRMDGDKLVEITDPDSALKIWSKSWPISRARALKLAAARGKRAAR
jgi:hypothetical protein